MGVRAGGWPLGCAALAAQDGLTTLQSKKLADDERENNRNYVGYRKPLDHYSLLSQRPTPLACALAQI